MNTSFASFRRPSEDQFDELWKRGLLVVDTNILLQLYRVPEATREEILNLLRAFGDRLWIPHHVGLEFERNRLTVIASARKQAEEILEDFQQLEVLSEKIKELELDKRSVGAEEAPLLAALSAAREKACEVLESVRSSHVQLSHDDPVRDAIHDLYMSRIGEAPKDQAAVDKTEDEGQRRFDNSVPPGFKDAGKDSSSYVAKGLRYQRKYGDYFVWSQTIDYVRSENVELIMYATLDNKEDWWQRVQGQTVGPLPELVHEMHAAGARVFWMYNLRQLVEQSKRLGVAKVSDTTLEEVKEVQLRADRMPEEVDSEYVKLARPLSAHAEREFAVSEWLRQRNIHAQASNFISPDLIARTPIGVAGYEIVALRHTAASLGRLESLAQAVEEIKAESGIDELHVFLVMDSPGGAREVLERFDDFASGFVRSGALSSVTVGYVYKGRFIVVNYVRHPNARLHGAR